ncbi:4'-phosphopantetheinyl transferase family protein [Kitasatospora mediocidica]|uniref:4'-phosphopantetheinyl transferase family protein n=1 Tax=Kitasatospora mediocidica TaxID=58352 RepID=UPI00068D643D|nr:4'-phosphopantetheinyl transferase superfamily protein [Kitasatospora mediocidica]
MSPDPLVASNPPGPGTGPLLPGECHIWWASATRPEQQLVGSLDSVELGRLTGYHHGADRVRFATARILLRTVAAGYLGTGPGHVQVVARCPDCPKPHGRPTLPGTGLEVSISHAGDLVAVAVTAVGPVGIDVEHIDPELSTADLLPHVLSEVEREASAVDTGFGFHRMWTRKEAVLKATGDGLRVPLSGLGVSAPDAEPRLLFLDGSTRPVERFVMADLDAGAGYAASIAVIGAGPVRFVAFHGDGLLDRSLAAAPALGRGVRV